MRFGLFLMPEPFPWSNWTLSYDLKLEEIVLAERLGFDEVWVGEHHTGAYENIPAPDLFIAKASALTHRIGLGTGTINLPYHDPFMVAERLAFLDHLTHGRLIYGFGGGGLVSDRSFFQLDKDEGTPRMHEALDIIEQLFANTEYIDYSGKFWDLDHKRIQVRPYQEHPQFSVAGMSGTHNFALCGERGYSALSIYFTPTTIENNPGMPDLVAQGRALANAASTAGRDPAKATDDWRICREVYVSDSKNAAMNEIREEPQAVVRLSVQDRVGTADETRCDDARRGRQLRLDGREHPMDHRLAPGLHGTDQRARRGRRWVRLAVVQLARVGHDRSLESLARAVRSVRLAAFPTPRRSTVPQRTRRRCAGRLT